MRTYLNFITLGNSKGRLFLDKLLTRMVETSRRTLRTFSFVRFLLVFAVVFSLTSFSGALSSNFQLPTVHLARANHAPCSFPGTPCSEAWVPAGPAMDTFLATIFTDESAEFTNLLSATPNIDLTDSPLTPNLVSTLVQSPDFYVTSSISEHGYFEIEFMLGATAFWGCNMSFGNSQCGIDIRQGISHLVDKAKFTTNEPSEVGISSAIDSPLPTSNAGLPSPNTCLWDNGVVPAALANTFSTAPVPGTMHGNANCVVGAPGGAAYHLASASGVISPWQPSISDLDFCAAAAHFIDAGLATAVVSDTASPATRNCQLTGVSPAVTANPISFYIRNDNIPMFDLGNSLAQTICALFTGTYSTGCGVSPSTTNILGATHGPSTAFSGFTTSTDHVDVSWNMYTAAFNNVYPFNKSLYFTYNSLFVSGISSSHVANGGTCDNGSVPTDSAGDYMYVCNANYDNLSHQMEFANCLAVPGDPTPGQTTPTFGTCSAGGLSAIGAGYQAEDAFGKSAFTLPVFQQTDRFGYLACSPAARPCNTAAGIAAQWHRAINDIGAGLPNFFTWLDAWNSNPTQAGTIRLGFKQTTRTSSPYIASTVWDSYIVHSVYDSLHIVNPLNNNREDASWMDISALPQISLTYTPPSGTVLTYRFSLFPNLQWQDGKPVTSFDVAFSYLSLLANGAFQSGGASSLSGVTILSPTQFDLNVKSVGPFSTRFLTGLSILPGRYWTCGTGTQPSTGTAPNIAPARCPSTAPSQWDSAITTCTSVGNTCYPVQYTLGTPPAQSACYPIAAAPCAPPAVAALGGASSFVANLMNADAVKTGALYDPIANHIFIGSGAWTCGTGTGLGQACTSGMVQNPGVGQSYTLKRNGLGITPGFPGDYVRSSGFLATYLWSGDISPGVNNFSAAIYCFGLTPLDPLSASPPASLCGRWQQGIGTNGATTPAGIGGCPAGTTPCGIPVGSNQVSIVKLYTNINWFYPDIAIATNCSGQVCLSFDSNIKFIDDPAATVTNAPGTWTIGKTVVYDKDGNGLYDVGVDSVIAGPGAIGAANCSGGTQICLSVDPHLKFIDSPPAIVPNVAGTWAFGKTVVYNYNGNGLYNAGDLVIAGTGPSPPFGIIPLDPVLYAGSSGTLSPATGTGGVGCANPYNPTSTTSGGYDC